MTRKVFYTIAAIRNGSSRVLFEAHAILVKNHSGAPVEALHFGRFFCPESSPLIQCAAVHLQVFLGAEDAPVPVAAAPVTEAPAQKRAVR